MNEKQLTFTLNKGAEFRNNIENSVDELSFDNRMIVTHNTSAMLELLTDCIIEIDKLNKELESYRELEQKLLVFVHKHDKVHE